VSLTGIGGGKDVSCYANSRSPWRLYWPFSPRRPISAMPKAAAQAFMAAGSGVAFVAAGSGAVFTADSGPAFTADTVVSIRAITDMAIPRTATTVTDRLQLAP